MKPQYPLCDVEIVSEILFSDRMVRKIMMPGNTTSHQALNCSRAPDSNDPQVTVSTGTPTPRKERADSVIMADDMHATNVTAITGKAFGRA